MQYQAQQLSSQDVQATPASESNLIFNEVFSLAYEELRHLASFVRRNEANVTINSTALVHEAWLKLKDSPHLAAKGPAHFKAIAAKAMRQVLVDEARRRNARKRGGSGEATIVAFGNIGDEDTGTSIASLTPASTSATWPSGAVTSGVQLLELDALLQELSCLDQRQAQIVESRFFGGLSVAETAVALGLSESSVERDWRAARAWLAAKMRPDKNKE